MRTSPPDISEVDLRAGRSPYGFDDFGSSQEETLQAEATSPVHSGAFCLPAPSRPPGVPQSLSASLMLFLLGSSQAASQTVWGEPWPRSLTLTSPRFHTQIREEDKSPPPSSPPPLFSVIPGGFIKQLVRETEKESKEARQRKEAALTSPEVEVNGGVWTWRCRRGMAAWAWRGSVGWGR